MLPWDDLRTVLAIAATGSLSGAARRLEVNHATVFRRLRAIEARVGLTLFVRHRDGYAPTAAGEEIAAAARRMEAEVLAAERRLHGMDLQPAGTVGVTTTDTLLAGRLSGIFAAFQAEHPGIALDVAVANQVFNLSRREADVAIRPGNAPPETLVGRRVGAVSLAIYAPRAWPPEATDRSLETMPWVGPDERMGYTALEAWMTTRGVARQCRYRVDTMLGMTVAVQSAIGVAVLPCYLADTWPGVVRLGPPIPELETDLWLLTHPDLRRVRRIRAFMEYVGDALHREPADGSPVHAGSRRD